jgi:hypothetical protein
MSNLSGHALPASGSPTNTHGVAINKIPLSPEWRRALEELANASVRGGTTEAVMLARGFTAEMVASLVLSGLAETSVETLKVGDRKIEVVRVRITDAGRFVLNNN